MHASIFRYSFSSLSLSLSLSLTSSISVDEMFRFSSFNELKECCNIPWINIIIVEGEQMAWFKRAIDSFQQNAKIKKTLEQQPIFLQTL